jgi:cytochrome c551/c552
MKKLPLVLFASVLVVSTAAYASMGGWAVVSVSKIPDAWITGKPLQLSWQVRQHGLERLAGLEPTLEVRSGNRRVQGATWAFAEDGETGYRGTITFPEPGEWQVTIHSGFGRSRAVLIPWRVVDSIRPVRGTVEEHLSTIGVAPLSEVERGRRMFVAKGCVTCHVHRDVAVQGEVNDVGPELTQRRFAADYLAKFLRDPGIKPSSTGKRMPNPELREKDLAPLIAFINAERRVTKR